MGFGLAPDMIDMGQEQMLLNSNLADRVFDGIFRGSDSDKNKRFELACTICRCSKTILAFDEWLRRISLQEGGIMKYPRGKHLLLLAGLIKPLTALDWSVNRPSPDENMGLKQGGMKILQDTLGRFIPGSSHAHLHKGPGDGSYMTKLQTLDRSWTQRGIADRLYVTIEGILDNHIKPGNEGEEFFQTALRPLMSQIVRRALRNRWYIGEKWNTERLQKVLVCSPNVLNSLEPSDLENALQEIVDEGYLRKSRMWEDEDKEIMGTELHAWVLKMTENVRRKNSLLMRPSDDTRAEIQEILSSGRRKTSLTQLRRDMRRERDYLVQADKHLSGISHWSAERKNNAAESVAREIVAVCGEDETKSMGTTYSPLRVWITNRIAHFAKRIEKLSVEIGATNISIQWDTFPFLEEYYGFPDFLRTYYDHRIFHAVRSDESRTQDLIPELDISAMKNILIGDFTDIPHLFGHNSVDLISATRSDSHENEEDFKKDMEGCISTLKPGGVMITDGCYASYSEIQRYDIIADLVEYRPDVQVFAIVDGADRVKSVIIHKGVPTEDGGNKFLTERDFANIIQPGHELQTLDEVIADPVRQVENTVRKKIDNLFRGDRRIFGHMRNNLRKIGQKINRETGRSRLRRFQMNPETRRKIYLVSLPQDYEECCRFMQSAESVLKPKIRDIYAMAEEKGMDKKLFLEGFKGFGLDPASIALLRRCPGFFWDVCNDERDFSDIPEEERRQIFNGRNEGIFRESISFDESMEILKIIDSIITNEDEKSVTHFIGFLNNYLSPEQEEYEDIIQLFERHRGSTSPEATDCLDWLEVGREFFSSYVAGAYKKVPDKFTTYEVRKKKLNDFTEEKLIELFFRINETKREGLELEAFQESGPEDIEVAITRVCQEVATVLRRSKHRNTLPGTMPPIIDHLLEPLHPGVLHTFPSAFLRNQIGNAMNIHRKSSEPCPSNKHILPVLLNQQVASLRENIGLLSQTNKKPIFFLNLAHCSTNPDLLRQMEALVPHHCIQNRVIDPDQSQFEAVLQEINLWSRQGGIIVVGGSHEDAFSAFGKDFSQTIMARIALLVKENPHLGLFATCFGFQTLSQGLGIGETEQGMLEIGAYGIRNTHPDILRGFGDAFSATFTHTGHVKLNARELKNQGYHIFGENMLTSNPAGVVSADKRVFACQAHTELPTNNSGKIRAFLDAFPRGVWDKLRREYGVGPRRLLANFHTAQDEQGNIIQPLDIGSTLLATILRTISDQIIPRETP